MNNDASLLTGPHRSWRSTKRPNDRLLAGFRRAGKEPIITGINKLPVAEGVPVLGPSAGSKGSKRNTQRSAGRRASSATRPRTWRRARTWRRLAADLRARCPMRRRPIGRNARDSCGRRPAVAPRRAPPVSVRNTMTQALCAIRRAAQQAERHGGADPQTGASHVRTWPANPRFDSDDRADGTPAVQTRS
jgi:hypothetical protein